MDNLQPQHTNRQYEEELRTVRGDLLKMGGLVERQIAEAMEALVNRDTVKAREIIARDAEVNRLDVETDEQCIRLLALQWRRRRNRCSRTASTRSCATTSCWPRK